MFGAVEGVIAIKKKNEFNDHIGPDPATRSAADDPGLRHGRASPPPARTSRSRTRARGRCRSSGSSRAARSPAGAAVLWVLSSPKERAAGSSFGSRVHP